MDRLNATSSNREPDTFERGHYINSLCRILYLNPEEESLVVGIEGQWGCGKTHTILAVKDELQNKEPAPIIVDYNPWLISSLDSLIEGFFTQLAAGIGTYDKTNNAINAAKHVLQFSKLLSPIKLIPGAEPWGSMVETVLNTVSSASEAAANLAKLDLQNQKERVKVAISKLNKPIIVVIDDIDRLPPKQIRLLFQLVKATADFDGVSYLLAYDRDVISKALNYDGNCNGEKYLEKIIMHSSQVPRISNFLMRRHFDFQLNKNDEFKEILTDHDQQQRYSELLNKTSFAQLLRTPRTAKVILNKLEINISLLKNEVFLADLIAIETLRISSPELFNCIEQNPYAHAHISNSERHEVAEYYRPRDENSSSAKESSHQHIVDLIEGSHALKDYLADIYDFIFISGAELIYPPDSCKRLTVAGTLMHYLHFTNLSFIPSEAEANEFRTNAKCRLQMLKEYNELGTIKPFLGFIGARISSHIENPEDMAEDIAEFCTKTGDIDPHLAAGFLANFFLITKKETAISCWKRLMIKDRHLAFNFCLLSKLGTESEWVSNGTFLSDGPKRLIKEWKIEDYYQLRNDLLLSVRTCSKQNDLILTHTNWSIILYWWNASIEADDSDEIRRFVNKNWENPEWLKAFANSTSNHLMQYVPDIKKYAALLKKVLPPTHRAVVNISQMGL